MSGLSTFTVLFSDRHCPFLEHSHQPPRYLCISHPRSSPIPLQPLIFFCFGINSTMLSDVTVFFSQHNVFEVCLWRNIYRHFIPFYGQSTSHCADLHIFCIDPSVDRHMGCYFFCTVMQNAAMNVLVHKFSYEPMLLLS